MPKDLGAGPYDLQGMIDYFRKGTEALEQMVSQPATDAEEDLLRMNEEAPVMDADAAIEEEFALDIEGDEEDEDLAGLTALAAKKAIAGA